MQGSYYSDETRQQFAALMLTGLTASAAGKQLGIPRATACAWAQRLRDESDEYAAERELEKRKMVRKCMKIVRNTMGAIDRQVSAACRNRQQLEQGLDAIARAAGAGSIDLSESEVLKLRNIVNDYTGIGVRDLTAVLKSVDEKQARLESQLGVRNEESAPEIHVQLTLVDPAEKDGQSA